jgi:hypothetical protein
MAKKGQFMTKTTSFGGKKVVMYSIDGLVWSTRKDELAGIKHRLDNQKVTLDLAAKEDEEKNTESEKAEVEGDDVEVAATDHVKSKTKASPKDSKQKIKQVAKGKAAKVKEAKLNKSAKKNSGKRKAA